MRNYNKGWTKESERHSLARRGVKTGRATLSGWKDIAPFPIKARGTKSELISGYDLTEFKHEGFQKVLEENGIKPLAEKTKRGWIWQGDGVKIVTANNPITGEYHRPEYRDVEKDYGSYMAVEGEREKVEKINKSIHKHASGIKEFQKDHNDFI